MLDRARLQHAVERRHNCKARLIATEPVTEEFDARAPWAGVVYHFVLDGHPTADLAYAWVSHAAESDRRFCFAVLRKAAIESASDAVRKVLLAECAIPVPARVRAGMAPFTAGC